MVDPWSASLLPELASPGPAECRETEALSDEELAANADSQDDELMAVEAIYADECAVLCRKPQAKLELRVSVAVGDGLRVEVEGDPVGGGAVSTLPPIRMRVRLPAAYPSHVPPIFALRCCWIGDAGLAAIADELGRVASECAEGPALSMLVEHIRENS